MRNFLIHFLYNILLLTWYKDFFYHLNSLVADIEGGKEAEGVWEQGAEENIWT